MNTLSIIGGSRPANKVSLNIQVKNSTRAHQMDKKDVNQYDQRAIMVDAKLGNSSCDYANEAYSPVTNPLPESLSPMS